MKTKLKKLSETRVEIFVTLGAEEMNAAREIAVKKLAKTVKVQGFRAGKVPAEIAEKYIDQPSLLDEELNIAVQNALIPAYEESKVQALAMPEVEVKKFVPNEMMEFTFTSDILPEVTVGDYTKLKVKKEVKKVTEKDIEDVVDDIAKTYADREEVKREVKKGDIVLIDFVGKEKGKAFEGGSAKDFELEIGSGQFIAGFEDGIIGKKTDDEFVLDLAFPKDYHAKEHAGQKVNFEVKIKKVFEKKTPAVDDKLAEKVGFKTIAEFRDDIKKNLESRYEYTANEKFKDDLVAELVKNSKVSAPEILIKDQLNLIKMDTERNISGSGMSLEEYLSEGGEKYEDWEKEARRVAEERVKASLVLQKVALAEKIDVEEKLVEAKIAELANVYGKSKEAIKSLKDPRVRVDIKNRMVIEKTLDLLVEKNSSK